MTRPRNRTQSRTILLGFWIQNDVRLKREDEGSTGVESLHGASLGTSTLVRSTNADALNTGPVRCATDGFAAASDELPDVVSLIRELRCGQQAPLRFQRNVASN